MKMYECHGHIMMDGRDFSAAKKRNESCPDEKSIRTALNALKESGILYFRDGGDNLGVSLLAREIAAEYGIQFVSPAFAIYKKGRYGKIIGKGYETISDYLSLINEVKEKKGDFIKLIVSGIVTFKKYGELSCQETDEEEIKELIHIAHAEGFKVMTHVNGDETVRACIESGADSIEHGLFMGEETLKMLAESDTVWVPTLAAVHAFCSREGFCREITERTYERHAENVSLAASLGAKIACGSDSGSFGMEHGEGTKAECLLLEQAGVSTKGADYAGKIIQNTFRRDYC